MPTPETIEQQVLQESVRRFIERRCGPSYSKKASVDPSVEHAKLWGELAQMGWLGIWIDDAYGGSKTDFSTLSLLLEEIGRGCLPGPYFESAVLVPTLLEAFGAGFAKTDILPRIANGELVVTAAIEEAECSEFRASNAATRARRHGDGYVIDGAKSVVPFAQLADVILTVARITLSDSEEPGQLGLFAVPRVQPGVSCKQLTDMSGNVACDVFYNDVVVPASSRVSATWVSEDELNAALLLAAVAKCSEMVGGAKYALEIIVAYAKERRQFGRAIGSFQAIQHHCTNVLVYVETARRLVDEVIISIDKGQFNPARGAIAKAWCNHSYREVVRIAHQVMGGIGYIDEHAMPWIFRHARTAEVSLGDQETLLELIATHLYAEDRGVLGTS